MGFQGIRRIIFGLITSMIVVSLVACDHLAMSEQDRRREEWLQDTGRLKVLCTIAMIQDLVAEIGGEYVDCLSLITGQLDPHTYEMVKGDGEKLSRADLVFSNGLDLEHGPSLRRYLAKSRKALALGDAIERDFPERILVIEGARDPHIWMDVSMWAATVDTIVQGLSAKDPQHYQAYTENGEALKTKMLAIHAEIRNQLQSISDTQRYLVTSHDAFNYFARAYLAADGETTFEQWSPRFQAPDGLAPDGQLSSTDIQEIIQHLAAYRIPVLFPESNVSQDAIQKVREAGRAIGLEIRIADVVLYGDAMGPVGSPEGKYLGMMEHNAQAIAEHLKDD